METTTDSAPHSTGSPVADFTLRATDGREYASLTARRSGLLLVAMVKVGCGTCKYAFPYVQRFHELYAQNADGRFQVWGISQNDAAETVNFAKNHGAATFPLLLDETLEATASYGITNVPDLYLLGPEETIRDAVVGYFSAEKYNALARRIADHLQVPYVPVVRPEDNAPALKPG